MSVVRWCLLSAVTGILNLVTCWAEWTVHSSLCRALRSDGPKTLKVTVKVSLH